MDKSVRNVIQRATQDARNLLEQEFSEQLEGVFDILPNGNILERPGEHITDEQRVIRRKLVAAIEHRQAGGENPTEAVAGYVREAAFTFLNRFVALKMLEARSVVQECISRNEQSAGFKEFCGLAPGLSALPDHGYRLYIESLFDEIGQEIKALFDRQDAATLLWLRRHTLGRLLDILNAVELAGVWAEDETIGWVYQYFNSDEERKQMRAESQAPRNSRELAVRNQFFTPRYVVQFLTDNTLGRIWYEMRQGNTKLRGLDFLVHRINEVFLKDGGQPPKENAGADENLSQEELLKKTVYIPFRPKKDPRDIKILDPACGSGHFLLYSFGLFQVIYEEAWADETAPKSDVTGRSLCEDYTDLDSLRAAVPGLILRHNLHGIDIDARCAQIAASALWMRAQRAYKDLGIERAERPRIKKTNIVVAEPMPGETQFRREFISALEPTLGRLVQRVFERMELAGEAGSLLRIEDDIRDSVRENYGVHGELYGIPDEERWRRAEEELIRTLRAYSEHAGNGRSFQRRLFAEDAERGLGFIDLCNQRYHVVLMNPPFGEWPNNSESISSTRYETAQGDIGAAFVQLANRLVDARQGLCGTITNRTFLSTSQLQVWRATTLLGEQKIAYLADLGYGVLDGAMVETAAYVIARGCTQLFSVRLLNSRHKGEDLFDAIRATYHGKPNTLTNFTDPLTFRALPLQLVAHWAPAELLQRLSSGTRLKDMPGGVNDGGHTGDDFRFLRLAWEVDPCTLGLDKQWHFFAKGGEYSPFWDDIHLVAYWHKDAREIRAVSGARIYHEDLYYKPGLTYPLRTTSDWSPRILPDGCLFSTGGHGIHGFSSLNEALRFLRIAYTRPMKLAVEVLLGGGDASVSGSAARNYTAGTIAYLPLPLNSVDSNKDVIEAKACVRIIRRLRFDCEETTRWFKLPRLLLYQKAGDIRGQINLWWLTFINGLYELSDYMMHGESESFEQLGLARTKMMSQLLDDIVGEHPSNIQQFPVSKHPPVKELIEMSTSELSELLIRTAGASRAITKKSYFVDRDLELGARAAGCPIGQFLMKCSALEAPERLAQETVIELLSWIVGVMFGRFDVRLALETQRPYEDPDPFHSLPQCSPGMLTGTEGLPVKQPQPNYPINFPLDGVLVDDRGHANDIIKRTRQVYQVIFGEDSDARLRETEEIADSNNGDLRHWVAVSFFDDHIRRYSKSRRQSPIYWQLATPSISYSIWLYYHRFTKDTLYKVLNDYVTQKLQHEERKITSIKQESGPRPSASQRREIADIESFVEELRAFRDEVARVAPLWDPDLSDGVIINFAPLWRLVPQHRAWQKECKACWDKLCKGDYDWAHLAMHLWPERVVPKCTTDRSLAIGHGLEEVFWQAGTDGKWQRREVPKEKVNSLIEERTSKAVKTALSDLLSAPTLAAEGRRGRRKAAARRSGRLKRTEEA